MSMSFVMLGDVVGSPGRLALRQCLPAIREQYQPDWVVANGENSAGGSGLTPEHYHKLVDAGVDGITLGDHVYRKAQIIPLLEQQPNLIRPANLSAKAKGRGWMRLRAGDGEGPSLYVVTLLGRLFLTAMPANDPFDAVDRVLASLPESNPTVLVEMHAEATSEKQAMGWYLNGRVAAVVGTHTHVPTADARILPRAERATRATGYISDLGMTGPHDSILGRRVDRVLTHMTTNMPAPFDVAEGNPRVNGIYVEFDPSSAGCNHIERIEMAADATRPPFTAG